MRGISIKEEWEEYRKRVVKTDNPVMIEIERQTFYSGAASMFTMVTEFLPTLSDNDAENYLKVIDAELRKFLEEIKALARNMPKSPES